MKYGKFTPIDLVLSNMVEVEFQDSVNDGFRKVKETLQRMGVSSHKTKTLFQTAHILHKQGRYYICHFKEMFAADGKPAELSQSDLARRNLIVKLLVDWGLVTAITDNWEAPMGNLLMLKVLKHSERNEWETTAKYTMGINKQAK